MGTAHLSQWWATPTLQTARRAIRGRLFAHSAAARPTAGLATSAPGTIGQRHAAIARNRRGRDTQPFLQAIAVAGRADRFFVRAHEQLELLSAGITLVFVERHDSECSAKRVSLGPQCGYPVTCLVIEHWRIVKGERHASACRWVFIIVDLSPPVMPAVLNREQTREVDRRAAAEYGMSTLVLMENAGRGVADTLCQLGVSGPVVICCGKGNNGGDGFVLARHLDLRGVSVRVLTWAEPSDLSGDAGTNFGILERSGLCIEVFGKRHDASRLAEQLVDARWVVDALLGTGAKGSPRPPVDAVIEQLNASGVPILAVDLPSGLDCDTGGAAKPTIRARHTCTFVAAKPGFFAPGAEAYTGRVHVLDIGAPRRLIERMKAEG